MDNSSRVNNKLFDKCREKAPRVTDALSLLGTPCRLLINLILISTLMFGCSGRKLSSEKSAREDYKTVTKKYRPDDKKHELPSLTENSDLGDFLTYAMLNNPRIEAAYYDWATSIENITVARSRPDPKIEFSANLGKMVSAVMVGLMTDIPGPGKLKAAGNVSAAMSTKYYYIFTYEVLVTAHSLKSAYYRLKFLEDNISIQNEMLQLIIDLETIVTQQNSAGRSSLQDVLRIQIEKEQLITQIDNLKNSRTSLFAEFKAALGLGYEEKDPPTPLKFTSSEETLDREKIFQKAIQNNPNIQLMEADIRKAQALINLEKKSKVPDFSAGVDVDVKANPLMFSPSFGMTLPIWRDKISASIAAAQFEKRSAEARLNNESIKIATELAMMLYSYDESLRNTKVLEEKLIPKSKDALSASRIGFVAGKSSFLDLIESYRKLLGFDLALIDAQTQREISLISLSLLIVGEPPKGSPILDQSEKSNNSYKKEGAK